jgi:hypothetical protein
MWLPTAAADARTSFSRLDGKAKRLGVGADGFA